jgi:XTP/dITP diphosphohydrolase
MSKTNQGGRIVLASNNKGKVREINQLLSGAGLEVVPQADFGIPDAEETGLSFVENAILKARNAAAHYSARYAGVGAADADNLNKLLEALDDIPEQGRSARFQFLMVYMRHAEDPTPVICQGTWEGRILKEPRGENGFGYDPVFYVPTHDRSAAELDAETKNALSHRGQALGKLLAALAG